MLINVYYHAGICRWMAKRAWVPFSGVTVTNAILGSPPEPAGFWWRRSSYSQTVNRRTEHKNALLSEEKTDRMISRQIRDSHWAFSGVWRYFFKALLSFLGEASARLNPAFPFGKSPFLIQSTLLDWRPSVRIQLTEQQEVPMVDTTEALHYPIPRFPGFCAKKATQRRQNLCYPAGTMLFESTLH